MKQSCYSFISVMSVRLLLSIILTILIFYYLPHYLNQRPVQQVLNNPPIKIDMILPIQEKKAVSLTEDVEVSNSSEKVNSPVVMSLPIMDKVADIALPKPSFVTPSMNNMSLPSLGPMLVGIKDVDQPPELLKYIQPTMPISARKYQDGGKVLLRLIVEADGMVSLAQVLEANPENVFDDSAINAALKWRFKPAILSGEAVRVFVDVPINFKVN